MNIEEKIREFIIKNLYYADGSALSDDTSFLAEGVIDSMGAMELVAFVESEFKIKVEMSEVVVKNFDSIRKLGNFVRCKLGIAEPQALEVVAQFANEEGVAVPAQQPADILKTD